jgi:hypothetical protein
MRTDNDRTDSEIEMTDVELPLPVDLIEQMEAFCKATGRTWDDLVYELMDAGFTKLTETEARLLAEAKAQGLSVQDLIERELWGKVLKREHRKPGIPEDRLELWKKWLNRHDYGSALLLLSFDTIESLYREREDAQV